MNLLRFRVRFDVMGHLVKGHLGGLGGHPLLQPMRVAMHGQVQLGIPWEETRHPPLTLTGACHTHGTKHTLIAGFHVVAFL